MENIEFLHPEVFYFLGFFLVFLVFYFFWNKKSKKKPAIQIPFFEDLNLAYKKIPFWKGKKIYKFLKWIFFLTGIILLFVSLARPQKISSEKSITKNGVDILIALDVSESMLADDLKPNRIEAAKKYISEFVSRLKTDRVGLEVFAGRPFTQSPMSFDYNVIRYYLSEISTDTINQQMRGLGGTAIGDAILTAINRFKNSEDRTRVLILLTDGENTVGTNPILAAEEARVNDIKIYTIGLGQKGGALVPIGVQNGRKIYARNPDGTYFRTKFDEKTLKDVAQISGGEYFWAGNNESLKKIFETISKLEKKEYQAETVVKKEDLFWNWLFWGFVFSSLALIFMVSEEVDFKILKNKKEK